jgi:translocation and assembly module TamA
MTAGAALTGKFAAPAWALAVALAAGLLPQARAQTPGPAAAPSTASAASAASASDSSPSPAAVSASAPLPEAPPPAPPPAPRPVAIDAPNPLKDLLATNLDLARASRLTGDSALDDGEWARLVATAPAQVRELAGTQGYFDPTVTIDVAADAARTIHVRVSPGPQAAIDRVVLQFDGDLDRAASGGDAAALAIEAELQRAWPMPAGTPFRNATWSDAKAQWLARLRARGYGAAVWSGTSATVDPATHEVHLFLVADSGPQFRAGNLMIEGLERQPELTVRRLAGFASGAPLEETRLLDYQDRLQKTGLFDQVSVTYDPDPAQAGHATVNVHVHEQRLQQNTVAAGISNNTGPRISLEYVNRLPFGQPVTIANRLVWGRDEQSLNIDLTTHPGENFSSWLTGVFVDRVVTGTDVTETERVRFGRTRDTTRLERLQFVQVERSVQCTVVGCVDARAASLNQHTVWRRLDSLVLPTDGWTLSTQVGAGGAGGPQSPAQVAAGGPSSKYGPFTRLYGRYTQYWPLPSHWYATGRVELGQVFVSDEVNVPEPELFRAGGDDSVRGYPYLSLAPTSSDGSVVGGKALLTLSAEIAHPIADSLPGVWWAAFVDAGRAAPRFNDLKLAVGPGLGIRWRSPVGPLRIDWAWGEELNRGRISVSIGIAF